MTREKEINIAASKYIEDNSMPDGEVAISDPKDSFIEGADWADAHPILQWISVDDDLPCNHEDYINTSDKDGTFYVIALVESFIELSRMEKDDAGTWHWTTDKPSYWMPIPELPKE